MNRILCLDDPRADSRGFNVPKCSKIFKFIFSLVWRFAKGANLNVFAACDFDLSRAFICFEDLTHATTEAVFEPFSSSRPL